MDDVSWNLSPLRLGISVLVALALLVQPEVGNTQESISEITIIHGGSSGIQPQAGYTKIPVDLNTGAGGDFIYLRG